MYPNMGIPPQSRLLILLLLASCSQVQGKLIYQTEPQRAVVQPGGSVSFVGKAGVPITSCQFWHSPTWNYIDLSLGMKSKSTDDYEYYGLGLEYGECGMRMKKVIDRNDGIIQSRIKTDPNSDWEMAASTLRVTDVDKSRLPVFEMIPKRTIVKPRDNLTVTCNTDHPIEMCHIYLPGGQFLNFDRGVDSEENHRYRYHGTGLQDGHCGATLKNVDSRINGIVVCKLGDFPETTDGVWETDSLNVVTSEVIYQTEPKRVVVRPGETITFLGKVEVPITSCQFFHAPSWNIIDLSLGSMSKSTNEYEYFGSGLENGECGIKMKTIIEGNDGIIQGRIKVHANSEWELSASTLRVTEVPRSELPVFEMNPKRARIRTGDELTLTCNTDRAIEMCHIYLPGGQLLDFNKGVESKETQRYRYHGTGLEDGQCGVTLKSVESRVNGIVVCKLGNFPESADGVWETDSLNVIARYASYQTEPQRVVVRPGKTVNFIGRAGVPITSCQFFHAPSWNIIDLSLGSKSKSTDEYEYLGSGLENGECGIKMKNIIEGNDGIIQSRIKVHSKSEWELSASTLRVTKVPKSQLPVFEMKPKRAILQVGDDITFSCNTNRAIEMCHIYLPGGQFLDFNKGVDSRETHRYRYHGTGLQDGHCGATMKNVDSRINGIVVCKLGDFPESTDGFWETDSLNVVTKTKTASSTGTTTTTSTTTPITTTTTTTTRPTMPPTANPVSSHKCGEVQIRPTGLITVGQNTQQGKWPWHVAMYRRESWDLKYICGGSLISLKAVVTAAHCVTTRPLGTPVEPDSLLLYFGKYHLSQWSELGTQNKQIKNIFVNPNYNVTSFAGDVAILILQSPVAYTDSVRPICLWPADQTDLSAVVEQSGFVVGWGFDETGVPTAELMMAKFPVVSQLKCLQSDPRFYPLFTSDKTFCTGLRNGTSVCNGDSGGGMFFPKKRSDNTEVWFIRGLVSISKSVPASSSSENKEIRVCDTKNYAVFTDLAKYLEWITPYAE